MTVITIEEKLFYGDKFKGLKSLEFQLLMLVEHIVTASYVWDGLPDEIDIDIPERTLFYFGQALFFKVGKHHAMTQTVGKGTVNIYGRFMTYQPILRGSLNLLAHDYICRSEFGSDQQPNAVLVRNNEQYLPTFYLVMPVIKRLASLWVTMGMKQALSRVKCLIQANGDSGKIVRQAIQAIVESDELFPIISDKRGKGKSSVPMLTELTTLQVYGDYEPSKDWYDFDKTWSLLMTMCGIRNNSEQNKKERLIVDEANANEEVVDLVNGMPTRLRKDAVERINNIFGLSVSVKTKAELQKEQEDKEPEPEEDDPKQPTD